MNHRFSNKTSLIDYWSVSIQHHNCAVSNIGGIRKGCVEVLSGLIHHNFHKPTFGIGNRNMWLKGTPQTATNNFHIIFLRTRFWVHKNTRTRTCFRVGLLPFYCIMCTRGKMCTIVARHRDRYLVVLTSTISSVFMRYSAFPIEGK